MWRGARSCVAIVARDGKSGNLARALSHSDAAGAVCVSLAVCRSERADAGVRGEHMGVASKAEVRPNGLHLGRRDDKVRGDVNDETLG